MTDQIKQLRADVEEKQRQCEKARQSLNNAVECLQGWCEHPVTSIVEVPHYSGLISDRAPIRLCRDCGLTEDGWYFKVLAPGVYSGLPTIDFHTCMSARLFVK